MANEAQSSPEAKRSWLYRQWTVDDDGKIGWLRLLGLGLLAAVLSYLVLYYGGIALKSYYELRGDEATVPSQEWYYWLRRLSFGGAVTIGTLTLTWRLIYRTQGQAHWGTALVVLGVLLFGVLVWPTPWTYSQFGCTVFQINRFRGHYVPVTQVPFCEPTPAAPARAGN